MKDEFDDRYCHHCDDDTAHVIRDSIHERDSSQSWRKCLVCGWEYFGLTGEYEPPRDDDLTSPPED